MSGFLISAIQIVIIAALIVLILTRPYLGIVITVASLPATDILPPIPLLTSVVSIFGYVTVGGYLMQRARERTKGSADSIKRSSGVSYFAFGFLYLIHKPLGSVPPVIGH